VELIKDYDCVIEYYPGKANVVANALSRKNMLVETQWDDSDRRELLELRKIRAQIEVRPGESLVAHLKIRSTLRDKVLEAQRMDVEIGKIKDKVKADVETPYQILDDGMMVLRRRMYLPNDETLKRKII
jgi:hypothetical protein